MISIGIVILNYLAYKSTIECIKSIRRCYSHSEDFVFWTVIVDNASTNESYQKLIDYFVDDREVSVIRTDKNEGFARGNNKGYFFLKEKYNPDFYVFCNDDIILKYQNIGCWIYENFTKYRFSVLGPKIYSVNGRFYQSPNECMTTDIGECICEINKRKKEMRKLYLKKFFGGNVSDDIVTWKNPYSEEFSDSLMLHGSFLVFSTLYFEHYDEPFDPNTFLYGEEVLLKYRCERKKIRMIYSPQYEVFHMQNMSTILGRGSNITKRIVRLKREISSLKVYLKYLRRDYVQINKKIIKKN